MANTWQLPANNTGLLKLKMAKLPQLKKNHKSQRAISDRPESICMIIGSLRLSKYLPLGGSMPELLLMNCFAPIFSLPKNLRKKNENLSNWWCRFYKDLSLSMFDQFYLSSTRTLPFCFAKTLVPIYN